MIDQTLPVENLFGGGDAVRGDQRLNDFVGPLLRRDRFGESAVATMASDLDDQLGHDVVRRADAAVSAELQSQSEHLVGAVVHDLVGTEADEQPLHRIEVVFRELVAGDVGNRQQ